MIQDTKLIEKLSSIHKSLTSVLRDDSENKKFSYTESEIRVGVDHAVLNEKIAYNRLKKMQILKELSENWTDFKEYYKSDNILKKIGEEFIMGKFDCTDSIIKTIEDYPLRKQTLYYFNKNSQVKVSLTAKEYESIKNQILPTIEPESRVSVGIKDKVLKSIELIRQDKSQSNLEKMFAIHEKGPLGMVKGDFGTFMRDLVLHIQRGDFEYEQNGSTLALQVPIAGERECAGVYKKIDTSVFTVDLDNPTNYRLEVGTIKKPILKIQDKINNLRETPEAKNSIKLQF